ncbi:glycosyltransferase family 2 protein [Ferruginibacter paludis]|uniref:glycosyltransferase family 2 protein n=1 Tax=Ferruginibacter paludis TaxID=1310417 RepID=UPI0025B3C1D7|nr:glycosyltransferase family 2 protein [Ferruginibacter paludis]MDN3654647.1 glycosyltransferase family 2 protein [Ferruginibacter paludis]
MKWIEISFWICMGIVFYAFLGYGIVLYAMVLIKRIVSKDKLEAKPFEPAVTLVIPCFNEADILRAKIANSKKLDYPADKLKIVFITDGSTDGSDCYLNAWPDIVVLHENRRGGKTAAENRAMKYVDTPFVIFSDANTMLNSAAVKNIVKHFEDDMVGCVSGEKRIINDAADSASAAGEGIYWKYESLLKKLDSELNSACGAAGELVAFRSSLYRDLPEDTLLDDFMQSMQMAASGYRIIYEKEAYAVETASENVAEELKRKIRICAGGWQSIQRLSGNLTMQKTPLLYFQYVSHRVLRWTITPFLLIAIFILNMYIIKSGSQFYMTIMVAQVLFYSAAIIGYILENRRVTFKPVFVPYYFCIMNYAVLAGLRRYLSGQQKATWDKAQRKAVTLN